MILPPDISTCPEPSLGRQSTSILILLRLSSSPSVEMVCLRALELSGPQPLSDSNADRHCFHVRSSHTSLPSQTTPTSSSVDNCRLSLKPSYILPKSDSSSLPQSPSMIRREFSPQFSQLGLRFCMKSVKLPLNAMFDRHWFKTLHFSCP